MYQAIGYEFLRQRYADKAFPHIPVARVAAVTRVTSEGDALLVPATVRRTQALEAGMTQATLEQTEAFAAALPKPALDRALQWAYLHETESSFAIEREAPTQLRAQAFVKLLQQAHEPNELTEQQLVALQNAVISN